MQSLARNIVTQNTPDIQVSGVFRLTERTYGDYPYRSAPLYLFDKSEVDEPTDYYFSLTLSSRISGRA